MPWKTIEQRREYMRNYSKKDYVKKKRKDYNDSIDRVKVNKKYRPTKRMYEWKRAGIKGDLVKLNEKYENTKNCEACNCILEEANNKSKSRKVLDHDHFSGHFRHILCNPCNAKRLKYDNIRARLMLHLHRYFNNNL